MPDQSEMMALERRPLTREQYAATLRDLHQAREPFFKAQADFYRLVLPRYVVHPDGKLEKIDDGLTPDMRESIRQLTEMMEQVSKPCLDKLANGYREDT